MGPLIIALGIPLISGIPFGIPSGRSGSISSLGVDLFRIRNIKGTRSTSGAGFGGRTSKGNLRLPRIAFGTSDTPSIPSGISSLLCSSCLPLPWITPKYLGRFSSSIVSGKDGSNFLFGFRLRATLGPITFASYIFISLSYILYIWNASTALLSLRGRR